MELSLLPILAFWSPGPSEMLLLALIALLLYGGNLPEVAKSWGKTFAEFRRSLSGIQNEFHSAFYSEPERLEYLPDTRPRDDAYAPESLDELEDEDAEREPSLDESIEDTAETNAESPPANTNSPETPRESPDTKSSSSP